MKKVKIYSFGFKYEDELPEFDLTYDLRRKLKNPVSHLPKGAIGLDKIVINTVLGSDTNKKVFTNIFNKVKKYLKENEGEASIAFACRSGIHRSVVFAEECASKLRKSKFEVEVEHIHLKEK
ncbi:MAG: hypothetical protein NE328_11775 [Lentisphaeraceae bacterium]|nr:hypothetical protein [Lentisphaeraceae bacterium]